MLIVHRKKFFSTFEIVNFSSRYKIDRVSDEYNKAAIF